LIDPGSEWRLHRQWYERSAMGDLLGEDFDLVQKDNLYRCLDKLLAHKTDLFSFLQQRWKTLFQAEFEVLLYDLTSTYFECDPPDAGKRRHETPCVHPEVFRQPVWRLRRAVWDRRACGLSMLAR
jgi:hypothetical protein